MIALNIPNDLTLKVTEAEFAKFAAANRDLRLERTSDGKMIIMPPTGSNTGRRNSELITQLAIWNKSSNLGVVFDSSTGFRLPNGSIRSPDVSWLEKSKWDRLTTEEQDSFAPICPDFVIELKSPTDSLKSLQDKMSEYLDSGLLLGWLINQVLKQVEIYRQGQDKEILDSPNTVSGEKILPGFNLDLSEVW